MTVTTRSRSRNQQTDQNQQQEERGQRQQNLERVVQENVEAMSPHIQTAAEETSKVATENSIRDIIREEFEDFREQIRGDMKNAFHKLMDQLERPINRREILDEFGPQSEESESEGRNVRGIGRPRRGRTHRGRSIHRKRNAGSS
eukprot:gb/GECH01009826.1/.p1 GENE.gb/GECH01009826.1/~~gb/GECH01009826.1/.p1  ORF type:complete len:145 (+),score=25.61 gb/GECH01009826.1/:1-435(+)